jgi:serine/threonine-protein kinase
LTETGVPRGATRSRPDAPGRLAPNQVVGERFVVQSVLGEGASGVVYAAADQKTGQDVALKLIHRHMLSDRQIRSRFDREAAILRRLSGKNLVALLAVGEHEGLVYMALERARGISLESLILREAPLSTERSARIVIEVCNALEDAHAAGVIHRDLKPANVMIETADGTDHVRVLDFGMAKLLRGDGPGNTALTEQNMVFGTPEYMAPEQARGDELDAGCDIYAAGVMLYELLTGTVPFTAPTPMGIMTAHLVDPVRSPSSVSPGHGIHSAIDAVVAGALEKDRRRRYRSASALRDALTMALASPDDPASVSPPDDGTPSTMGPRGSRASIRAPGSGTAAAADDYGLTPKAWILIGLAAAAAGVGIGVWISLRG